MRARRAAYRVNALWCPRVLESPGASRMYRGDRARSLLQDKGRRVLETCVHARPSKCKIVAPETAPPVVTSGRTCAAALETQTSSAAVPESTPSGAVVPLATWDHEAPS